MNSNPEPTGSMSSQAYEKLKAMILQGRLSQGQKLVYADLADRLSMSKTPIISALNRLESEGYVYLKRNIGYYVKEADRQEIVHLMQARELLEVANLDMVMANKTPQEIKELEAIHADYLDYSPDFFDRRKAALNSEFHLCLARMGKNSYLNRYIEHIYEWMNLRIWFNLLPPSRVKRSAVQHEKILAALKENNISKLKRAVRNHLRGPTKIMIERLDQFNSFS